jgi:putative ABC transport system ATP-binding protein
MGRAELVRVAGVSKSYAAGDSRTPVLTNLDLSIGEGEVVALVGPSGSGKTTLLNLLAGLDRPDGGEILVGDVRLGTLKGTELDEYRLRTVGFVFQASGVLGEMTAAENVSLLLRLLGWPPHEARREALSRLADVGLAARADHRCHELSGGEEQRVAVARALSKRPSLLLADEPTGQLDSETSAHVVELLVDAARSGVTVVLATHDQRLAKRADRTVQLGRPVAGEEEPDTSSQSSRP